MSAVVESSSYWTAYWWMLPVGVLICSTACAASVEGATMFTPLFALGFPLLGVSALTPGQAIATALIIESVGYSSGLAGHARQGTVVWSRVRTLGAVAVAAAALTATVASNVPGAFLLLVVAGVLLSLGVLVFRAAGREAVPLDRAPVDRIEPAAGSVLRAADGRVYRLHPDPSPFLTYLVTAAAAALTGLVGIGIGEVTSGQLMLRLGWPGRVAVGTGVGVVLPTVVTAGAVQAVLLQRTDLGIPWNLVVWTVPAVLIGGQLGPRLTAVVPERQLKQGVAVLFVLLGAVITLSTVRRLTG